MSDHFYVPNLLQIGSTGRNSGKTTIAKQIIENEKKTHTIVALKIITISGKRGVCQRGTVGCGICTSISSGYELVKEQHIQGKKDTMQLLKAGAEKVYLLKAFEEHLQAGFLDFLKQVSADAMIVCESNSLRKYIRPGLFIMDNQKKSVKPTAQAVYELSDEIFDSSMKTKEIGIKNTINGSFWEIKVPQKL
ncbi:hypothetical protein [Tetragenococcus halophilus]|uniref:Molybdopterin-guanine dinucleotide biosynthesis protein B (MobB) domain-containing protein n=1 Tax=Tetragenococcus halophilus TaxID=51669 RepID=A0AB37D3B9_TETHA|nr:hypothetical protein [Tetragenococcus halophilus]QGP76446.1 hypothetical protein GLW17_06205 [Tetragenococcus halophilus]